MSIVKLNQKDSRLEINKFEIDNPISFAFFDSLPMEERDNAFLRALYIGVLALKEDRLSAFLSKTSNELGTELENLKIIFDMKQELFFKSAVKGMAAEDDIAGFLTDYCSSRSLKDVVSLTGNQAGALKRNKTGDIVCHINGNEDLRIVIECKFDKSIKLGSIETKDIFGRKADTVWSQLLESNANRLGKVSIIVLDVALVDRAIQKMVDKVGFIPSIGFIAIIDSQRGDYSSLAIAYSLARNIAINAGDKDVDKEFLGVIIKRIISDLQSIKDISGMIDSSISGLKKLKEATLKSEISMSFTYEYLMKFINDGSLTKEDMFDFFMGGDVKERYKVLENELNKTLKQ